MAPNDDVERPRASSAAERQKSIVSMTEFEGMDEYTALQKYILFYRDTRTNPHAEQTTKKKAWWQFWKSGSATAATPIQDAGAVPDDYLNTELRTGLTSSDVEQRRKRYGFNEISSEKTNLLKQFIGYFTGPILYVMELAALLAAGLQDWVDFGVICGILLLNAIVGWYQEKQAADVVASLKGDIAMKATVVRDNQQQTILARELVPGDIVVIEEGQSVPGDARLICGYDHPEDFDLYMKLKAEDKFHDADPEDEKDDDVDEEKFDEENPITQGHPLVACDQSSITGESLAVDKYMGEVAYYTTGCKRGKAYGIVITTAKHSFVGRTATLVQGAQDQGHFKAIMNSIGTALLVLVMFFILLAWIGGFFRHIPIATAREGTDKSVTLLHYALIMFIVGVPVGLPVVTTTTLAVGAAYLAEQKAIVQKLTAIESLAGVDVLCSDKTGTLTANQLSLREPYVAEGQDVNWMMAVAALASSHNLKSLDPIDKVTILTIRRYPKAREILNMGWKTEKFTPFDPVSKRITAVCHMGGDKYVCAKGAPKAIVNLANCDEVTATLYKEKAAEFARRGFRSLGVAYQKNDGDWILLGLLSMFDPPREDTAQTIIEAQQLGVPVKMLTGDAIAIAKETCKMLALGTKVYNSSKLIGGGLTGTTQHDLVERADGFAEVFPEHKYQVVEMLQQRGHLTAMTGDGVNDAPSLKKSDCGIAVEGSTEAAQAAADIVFLAPGLSTIVLAIKTSRQIFQLYLVTSMIILNETIRAELIVFLALFADLATVAVAYDNAHSEQRPVEWQLPKIWFISVILGLLLALGTWIVRGTLFIPSGGIIQNFGAIQPILFLEVALTENWLIFVTRGGKTFPSFQLIIAILGVDALATIFTLFGWMSGAPYQTNPPTINSRFRDDGWVDIVTVVVVWAYSIGVTIIIAIVYYLLNRIAWLDTLGRKDRSRKNPAIENMIAALSKLSLEHGKDKHGTTRYVLAPRAVEEEDDE
ncbi:Plasma membrane ATPase 1 [Alternaria tenuissima]|uniref:Plasma membrane ATPase n=1 Tax=Alternaria tenuissima TaxID=119927 RepID=A0ABY0GM82_9PLEO|nr:Plasma membrane ATPase 1 [Alternaria tenuissima]